MTASSQGARVPQKNFKPTPAMIAAAEILWLAMARRDYVEPIVETYKRGILARHRWAPDPEYGADLTVVLDPKHSYLLSPEHSEIYFRESNEARQDAGLFAQTPDHCPALVAQDDVRKAERAMVDLLEPITGLDADGLICSGLANYKQYVELSLGLLIPFCNAKKRLEAIQAESQAGGTEVERPRG